jgi:hypothetical protein
MTLQEASVYLGMEEAALRRLAAERRVPCVELEGTWVFSKKSLDKWRIQTERRRS